MNKIDELNQQILIAVQNNTLNTEAFATYQTLLRIAFQTPRLIQCLDQADFLQTYTKELEDTHILLEKLR